MKLTCHMCWTDRRTLEEVYFGHNEVQYAMLQSDSNIINVFD